MRPNKPYKPIVEELLGRRTVLEWLGKGAVLAFSGKALAGCASPDDPGTSAGFDSESSPAATDGSDSGSTVLDTDTGTTPSLSCDFPFTPGTGTQPVFDSWGERTVEASELLDELSNWRLVVDGLVKAPFELTFAQLVGLPRRDQVSDFHCVEGWTIENVPWNGVHLGSLLDLAEPLPNATHITIHSVGDLYLESMPLAWAREAQTLLAYGIDCHTIPKKHGFPTRLVLPRKWAYKSSKFVYRLQLDDQPRTGYWEQYGYPYDGDVSYKRLEALKACSG